MCVLRQLRELFIPLRRDEPKTHLRPVKNDTQKNRSTLQGNLQPLVGEISWDCSR